MTRDQQAADLRSLRAIYSRWKQWCEQQAGHADREGQPAAARHRARARYCRDMLDGIGFALDVAAPVASDQCMTTAYQAGE